MRLLCVEDEVSLREDIAEYLRMQSHEVDEAATGEEAMSQLRQKQYDLVLCDIKMPHMDGYELLRNVRQENQMTSTPFLFLSALTDRDDRIRAHEGGCDAYLTKPIDFSVLEATLRSHVERQRARNYLYASTLDASQRHMISAIDDALTGPVAEANLIIQHLRETVPVLTPTALDNHLATMQTKLSAHMVELHTFHSALELQAFRTDPLHEVMLLEDLIRAATAECLYHSPAALVRYKATAPTGDIIHGDMRMLQRALAGLLAAIPDAHDTKDIIACQFDGGQCTLVIADHPSMLKEQDYIPVDATTDLTALSDVTRDRVTVLTYAVQVVQAHRGQFEIMIWPDDRLAVRFTLPQSGSRSVAA